MMVIKNRLQELKSHPDDNIAIDSYHLNRSGKSGRLENVENKNHLIGSGGRLADFFDNVEKISNEIDAVQNDVQKIKSNQLEILSKAENEQLQDRMEELQSDMKERSIRKIRSKVSFCIYLYSHSSFFYFLSITFNTIHIFLMCT